MLRVGNSITFSIWILRSLKLKKKRIKCLTWLQSLATFHVRLRQVVSVLFSSRAPFVTPKTQNTLEQQQRKTAQARTARKKQRKELRRKDDLKEFQPRKMRLFNIFTSQQCCCCRSFFKLTRKCNRLVRQKSVSAVEEGGNTRFGMNANAAKKKKKSQQTANEGNKEYLTRVRGSGMLIACDGNLKNVSPVK